MTSLSKVCCKTATHGLIDKPVMLNNRLIIDVAQINPSFAIFPSVLISRCRTGQSIHGRFHVEDRLFASPWIHLPDCGRCNEGILDIVVRPGSPTLSMLTGNDITECNVPTSLIGSLPLILRRLVPHSLPESNFSVAATIAARKDAVFGQLWQKVTRCQRKL
ncbi:uncharacterized protein EI90DRAFT_3057321 [Cantharellus anzutake]|uniref:uncharacterized protein n=1 Tax=Cantharellus anzutake TaxID=1750568 RepID=UPI001904DC86|nr:uncharacterized protein EI90DRAFT_3057321 [Cantharellus anzutake]KAF8331272.1 hypothetical protein EI90DRAFT_3057321 [Cantharellus anzutake]